MTGSVAGSTWTQGTTGTLNVTGPLLATGTLTASANGNTVNYNGAAQTVTTSAVSGYNTNGQLIGKGYANTGGDIPEVLIYDRALSATASTSLIRRCSFSCSAFNEVRSPRNKRSNTRRGLFSAGIIAQD